MRYDPYRGRKASRGFTLPSTPGSPKYLLHNVLIIAPTCSGLTSWPSSRLPEATAYEIRSKHAAAVTKKIARICKFYCSYKKLAFVNTWHERLLTALSAIRRRETQFRDQRQCGYTPTSTSAENEDGKLHNSMQEHDLTDHTHVKSTDSEPRGKRTDKVLFQQGDLTQQKSTTQPSSGKLQNDKNLTRATEFSMGNSDYSYMPL